VDGSGQSLGEPTATITGNTAIGNVAGDLADDADCRFALWVDNRFGTAPSLAFTSPQPGDGH
jgi:hypothetical protein